MSAEANRALLHRYIDEVIAEDERIAFRSNMRGTHRGEFLGITPTGKKIHVWLLDLIHIEDGLFVEQWGGPNLFDLVEQLGENYLTLI
ncbi:MAG TPA: ester cyclase [Anaerolineales bacterium]|jgi:predicted ester cyclase|nr:ester cyclase [Anaerolineales bacterium]